MFVVTVVFTINPDHLDPFRKAMITQAKVSLEQESECHQFDVAYDPTSPQTCFLYELYTDKAAFDLHLESAHFDEFNETVADWVDGKSVKTYEKVWPE